MSTYSIAELLSPGESRSFAESALVLTASSALLMHPERVKRLLHRYGRGNLYTPSGLCLPDSPNSRKNLTNHYDRVLLYAEDGRMSVLTTKTLQEPFNIKRDRSIISSKRKRAKEHSKIIEDIRRERMFSEQQTQPSPKHQGKANSHADIGRYNTSKYPRIHLSEYAPKSTTRLVIIKVAI